MCTPTCPMCNAQLQFVRQSSDSYLNREQFNAAKAGSWYCEACKDPETRTGFKYWSNTEVKRSGQELCNYHENY